MTRETSAEATVFRFPYGNLSLAEYMVQNYLGPDPAQPSGEPADYLFGEYSGSHGDQWLATLDKRTPLPEVLSLIGVEDPESSAGSVIDRAEDLAIPTGNGTVGDLRASGAPDLYRQLFLPETAVQPASE